jgi:cytochrome c oxidase subunit 3
MTLKSDAMLEYKQKTINNRLGLWLFIVSDAFVFGGLLVARSVLWGDTRPHLDQTLGLIVTSVLLISSFFMNRAEVAIQHGDTKNFLRGTLITIVLGVAFLAGVVGIEWQIAPIRQDTDVYGAIFYMMTGMHALHVLSGVIFLLIIYRLGKRGLYNTDRHWPVEAAAVYWHFVDVVWIVFYPALYLVGRLV